MHCMPADLNRGFEVPTVGVSQCPIAIDGKRGSTSVVHEALMLEANPLTRLELLEV